MLFTALASLALMALAPLPVQVGSVDLGPNLIEIAGEGHKRTIAVLEVSGTGQVVRWRSSGQPRQILDGFDNTVTRVRN